MLKRRALALTLMGSTILSAVPMLAAAQNADESTEVIVTAQKRSERLQSVPMSMQAYTTKKLDQLNVSDFDDYAVMVPSVSFQSYGPGSNIIYMRGVASGGDGNHSGSLPSVGVYLDEQPVTTIGGTMDVNIYDMARIEILQGPQGTLYGASSQAGTIRMITNKPDTSGFYGRFDVEGNTVAGGGTGGSIEGMLNIPVNDKAAVRLVGWVKKDAGYIDNVAGTRSFYPKPGGIVVNNNAFVEDDFNTVETYGARAALKVDLDDNWTVNASLMGQDQRTRGVFGHDPSVGDLEVQHFYPDRGHDRFYQAALTVTGKFANLDVTYAASHMERSTNGLSDYTDYAEAYDELYSNYGGLAGYVYLTDAAGNDIDPRQNIDGAYKFIKDSHELRVTSPVDQPLSFVAGIFYQKQHQDIHQDYRIPGLSPAMSVNGFPGTLWLTQQERNDQDFAVFGELTWTITPKLSAIVGVRSFTFDNDLIGFFGFGRDIANGPPWNGAGSSRTGVAGCYTSNGDTVRNNFSNGITTATLLPAAVAGSPCTNLAQYSNGKLSPKVAKGDGSTYKFRLAYKATDNNLIYFTASNGFRPGGINRRGDVGDYDPDYLSNLELGMKNTLLDGRLRLNGAIYKQVWESFQFSFLGANSFTEIHNGPDAEVNGLELDFNLQATSHLSISGAYAYTDSKMSKNLCAFDDPTFQCGGSPSAAAGTRLPITPEHKFSTVVRYTWDWEDYSPYWQVALNSQTDSRSDVRDSDAVTLDGFSMLDFAIGGEMGGTTFEFFAKNLTDERAQLTTSVQCGQCERRYYVVAQPRTIGVRLGRKF